jgi:serine/threonine-protein kinase
MNAVVASPAICSTCGHPLNGKGNCLVCLASIGLDEADGGAAIQPGQLVFGDFEIEWHADGSPVELGHGAMGITYRAKDQVLEREVALKVIELPAESSGAQATRERFLREARAAAAFRHPNVASVFQFGVSSENNRCYYAMELIEGETLAAFVRREGPLKERRALEITIQVTKALVAAAGHGLVHRDLKPSNIMLSPTDVGGDQVDAKVIDFGLAKATLAGVDGDLTHGGFVGTPTFASPEQLAGAPVDARSDLYSLGVTLWYALAGELPLPGKTIEEVRVFQAKTRLPVEQLSARKISARLIKLLCRTLATDPEERPQSARALLPELEACLAAIDQPRRPRRIAAVTLGALILIGGAGYYFYHQKAGTLNPPEKSVAVLPFANLSTEKENAYFASGVQDDTLSDLARIADLKVISRTSVAQYEGNAPRNIKQIGKALAVANIVEGSVQRVGNHIRVVAQLIDAQTDSHLWSETYDRDLTDVFAVQSEIAQTIAEQLHAKLSPVERAAIEKPATKDPLAYDLYVRGVALIDPALDDPDLKQDAVNGIKFLEAAIARDPSFLLAYCKLAQAHDYLYLEDGRSRGQLAQADYAVKSALRLGPDSGEAHLSFALHLYWGYSDYDRARAELAIASHTLPNNSRIAKIAGLIDRRQGRWPDAVRELERSAELDPQNPLALAGLISTYFLTRSYGPLSEVIDRRAALKPNGIGTRLPRADIDLASRADTRPVHALLHELVTDDPPTAEYLAEQCFWLGVLERDPDAAARALAAATRAKKPINATAMGDVPLSHSFWVGLVARMKGDNVAAHAAFDAARAEQEELTRSQSDVGLALSALGLVDAYLGRKEDALSEARRAIELLPVAKNSLDGADALYCYAVVCALTGEQDLAFQQLEVLAKIPAGTTYGDLCLNPYWDPLRGDPRFDKIVASLAPKPSEK